MLKSHKIYHCDHSQLSQFSTVKYIHIIVTQISRTFSSCKTETLYPLNDSFFLPLPCHISGITVVQQHPWHSICRRNSTAPRKCTCCVGYRCAVCSASIPPSAEPLPLDCDLHESCFFFLLPSGGTDWPDTLQLCIFLDHLGSDNAPAGQALVNQFPLKQALLKNKTKQKKTLLWSISKQLLSSSLSWKPKGIFSSDFTRRGKSCYTLQAPL